MNLSEIGRLQVGETALQLRKEIGWLDKIYVSSLTRCRESASILNQYFGCPIQPAEELKEIHMGIWEGRLMSDIQEIYPEEYQERGIHMDRYRVKGGESFQEVALRSLKFVKEVCGNTKKDSRVLILTHAGVIRCILSYVNQTPLKELFQYRIPYGAYVELNENQMEQLLRENGKNIYNYWDS